MNGQTTPILSFLLPCYNVSNFVSDCIRSLTNQGLEEDAYEIICIDDCSTDDTFEKLKELSKTTKNLYVFQNEYNGGASYTRNNLLKKARGEYIWFIDSDDFLCPFVAKVFLEYSKKCNADILWGNFEEIPEEYLYESCLNDFKEAAPREYTVTQLTPPVDSKGKIMWVLWGGVMKKSFLLENNLRLNEKCFIGEDALFYFEALSKTKEIYKIDKTCYLYRIRPSSLCHNRTQAYLHKNYLSVLEMLRVYEEYLEKGEYTDRKALEKRIHQAKESIVIFLAFSKDIKFIKEELKKLKKAGIYPYKFRKEAFAHKRFFLLELLDFLLPLRPFFWFYHFLRRIQNRI